MAWEPNAPLVMEDIEVDTPQAHEIRIKVRKKANKHKAYLNSLLVILSYLTVDVARIICCYFCTRHVIKM